MQFLQSSVPCLALPSEGPLLNYPLIQQHIFQLPLCAGDMEIIKTWSLFPKPQPAVSLLPPARLLSRARQHQATDCAGQSAAHSTHPSHLEPRDPLVPVLRGVSRHGGSGWQWGGAWGSTGRSLGGLCLGEPQSPIVPVLYGATSRPQNVLGPGP